ncbi:flavin reductase [Azoarcus indigens]|uniref:Flavin reductase (DIM6/NTAB) family NADH-FMN oxidoreductase RutF n=1 Tax=Azoarcus indigens TaxID=29545 RepID=A0A4R6DLL8_9RHOO|nr:flavin reductase family protein [Azoarcus indigens]NMG66389.1 flavin reductase [Azoarcus indigens]TDN45078.1 flavin reductase (DIM6/NTAB) family NADH-FMN oxidoreductase RutF [Azoarcus indigens]
MSLPSNIVPVPLPKAHRLLNHGPTVLVSSAHGGRRNVMAAAWNMTLDFEPPKIAVVIDRSTYTRELLEASGEFVIGLPSRAMAATVVKVGSTTGHDGDKFAELGLESYPAAKVAAPLVAGCVAWLECRLIPEPHIQQRYDLFLGEVIAAWAEAEVFPDSHWQFPSPAQRTIHHVAGGHFFVTGEAFEVPGRS